MSYDENGFLYKTSCEQCGSSDANAVYTDGHTYCFSCSHRTPPDGSKELTTSNTSSKSFKPLTGEFMPLNSRNIHQDTCEHMGYFWSEYAKEKGGTPEPVQVANIRNARGEFVGQKVRFKDKDFRGIGRPQDGLFGMHKFKTGLRLVITEGEIDALSVSQFGQNQYPVVSIPTGSKGAAKTIANHLAWLEGFKEIILFFDNDEAGREAIKEVANILPAGKTKVAKLPEEYKDANDALMADDLHAIKTAIFNAQPYKPDGLLTIKEIKEKALKPIERGIPWFLPTLTEATYGRRTGELVFLGAGTGVGKTDFLTQSMAFDLFDNKVKVAGFLLEQEPVETTKRIAGKKNGKLYHIPTEEDYTDELNEIYDSQEMSPENFVLYDSWGVTDWDSMKTKINYLVTQGFKYFYIDHLTALATGSEDKDERKELERITAEMASMCKKHNIWMLVISHLTTPESGSHEEGARVKIRHFKGSRAIGFWAYFMFGIERNQQADDPDEASTANFRVLKDRFTGRATGLTIPLGYDRETGRQFESSGFDDATGSASGANW